MSGVRHVFTTMGTVVSLRIDDTDDTDDEHTDERTDDRPDLHRTLRDVQARFDAFDAEFSRWRDDSPASRIAAGAASLLHAAPEHKHWYAEAARWRAETGGAFDPHRPDGTIDLAGIVKAAAIAAAGDVLDEAGLGRWCCNAGGDVLTSGASSAAPWRIGISHPDDAAAILSTVVLEGIDRAVATSGTSQRGEHVWRTDRAHAYRQVTVVAADIVTADVLATALLAGGPDLLVDAVDRWRVGVIAVTTDGDLVEAQPTDNPVLGEILPPAP